MSSATRAMAGLILTSIPTIAFGGYFLRSSLIDKSSGYAANALRQDFFHAGHAHAGVITLLVVSVLMLGIGLFRSRP